jgi:hypothetical protein
VDPEAGPGAGGGHESVGPPLRESPRAASPCGVLRLLLLRGGTGSTRSRIARSVDSAIDRRHAVLAGRKARLGSYSDAPLSTVVECEGRIALRVSRAPSTRNFLPNNSARVRKRALLLPFLEQNSVWRCASAPTSMSRKPRHKKRKVKAATPGSIPETQKAVAFKDDHGSIGFDASFGEQIGSNRLPPSLSFFSYFLPPYPRPCR